MDKDIFLQRINTFLETASPEELERLSRILERDLPVIRLKHRTGRTFLLELPVEYAEAVTSLCGSKGLEWEDGRTDLQRSIDERLARMRG